VHCHALAHPPSNHNKMIAYWNYHQRTEGACFDLTNVAARSMLPSARQLFAA
jgi:hypothetical protein